MAHLRFSLTLRKQLKQYLGITEKFTEKCAQSLFVHIIKSTGLYIHTQGSILIKFLFTQHK